MLHSEAHMTGSTTPSLIDYLRQFNRKERFFLVGWALGNPSFTLGESFCSELQKDLQLPVGIPADAFVAMDYHLEWLYAALRMASNGGNAGPFPNPPQVSVGGSSRASSVPLVLGNQEDIDLLIAFASGDCTYLLLIEAKGATGFTNKQMLSKVRRLSAIFNDPSVSELKIEKRLIIASPVEPSKLVAADWQPWMLRDSSPKKPWWIPMAFPKQALAVSRCDAVGHPSAEGTYWTVVQVTRTPPVPAATASGMGSAIASISQVSSGQQVTYRSTVSRQVEIGTVVKVDAAGNRLLVKRPNGTSGWMLLRTCGTIPTG
jgi:hypothetical protein